MTITPSIRPGPQWGEEFTTGTGQRMRVHEAATCDPGAPCVIHRPSAHPMAGLPLHWRTDRRIFERICTHGVGHPDPDGMAYRAANGLDDAEGIHGCDGCCRAAPTFADEVLGELRALHWGSHAKGATIPEIVAALRIRRVPMPEDHDRAILEVCGALVHTVGRWTMPDDGRQRDGHYVYLPIEPAFA